MRTGFSQSSLGTICSLWALKGSHTVLVRPSELCFSGVIVQLLLQFVRDALPAASPGTSVTPRVESHQLPPHSPSWRGELWSCSTLSAPSALQRPGPPVLHSGHPEHRTATAPSTAPPPRYPQLLCHRLQSPSLLESSAESMNFASMQEVQNHQLVEDNKSRSQPGETKALLLHLL